MGMRPSVVMLGSTYGVISGGLTYTAQNFFEKLPGTFCRRQAEFFPRGMSTDNLWTEGQKVHGLTEILEFFSKKTAFQTGVNSLDSGFFMEKIPVGLFEQRLKTGIRIVFPCRIVTGMLNRCPNHASQYVYLTAECVFSAG